MDGKEQENVKLGSLAVAERIFIIGGKPSKAEVIKRLVKAVCDNDPKLDAKDVATQVLRREEGISTTLDTGLSIPHARLEELDGFKAALAILPQGIEDPSGPRLEIKAMFLFLSPARQAFFQKHLQILAQLAEVFKADFIADLARSKNPAEAAAKIAAK